MPISSELESRYAMLEYVKAAFGILAFGSALSLTGLWILTLRHKVGLTQAGLQLAGSIALLAGLSVELMGVNGEVWCRAFAWAMFLSAVVTQPAETITRQREPRYQRSARQFSGGVFIGPSVVSAWFPLVFAAGVLLASLFRKTARTRIQLSAFALATTSEFVRVLGIYFGAVDELVPDVTTTVARAALVGTCGLLTMKAIRQHSFRMRNQLELITFSLVACAATLSVLLVTPFVAAEKLTFPFMAFCLPLIPICVLLGALAAQSARRMTGRLEELSAQTKPMLQGNLNDFSGVRSDDEIGNISTSILVMVRAVQKNREDLENQLARHQEFDKLRQQFMSNVSHELRTPLTLILGNADILLEEILGELNEQQREFLTTIRDQGQLLHQLVTDVLAFSDLKAGKSRLHIEAIEVRQLIVSVLERFSGLMRHKQLKVQGKVPDTTFPADPDKFREILVHLLSNAVKFSKKGGSITVKVIPPSASGSGLQVEVKDSGIGIAKKELTRIFDTFYQVDGSSTREHGGTGIGLTIVKHYIDLHGGSLNIQSEVGTGTTVRFELPHRPDFVPKKQPQETKSKDSAPSIRVLLASQNGDLVRILKTYLVQGGFDVITVPEGSRVAGEARRLQPRLILLDPDTNQGEAWETLSGLLGKSGEKLPTVILSSKVPRSVAMSKGAVDFIELPVDYKTFIRRIRAATGCGANQTKNS